MGARELAQSMDVRLAETWARPSAVGHSHKEERTEAFEQISIEVSVSDPAIRNTAGSGRFYKWPVRTVIPFLYRWARMRRTQPESVVVFNTVVPVLFGLIPFDPQRVFAVL